MVTVDSDRSAYCMHSIVNCVDEIELRVFLMAALLEQQYIYVYIYTVSVNAVL